MSAQQAEAKSSGPGVNRLYLGQVVWVKTGKYPWWPSYIADPTKVLPAVLKHRRDGHFVFKYLGHTDLGWAPNKTQNVRVFRHADFDAMAKNKQIRKALEEAQQIEEELRRERGDDWDEQPDSPDDKYLYVPFNQPEWDDDDEEDEDGVTKKTKKTTGKAKAKPPAKRTTQKKPTNDEEVSEEDTTTHKAKRARTKDSNAQTTTTTTKKPRTTSNPKAPKKKTKAELAAEKLERKRQRATVRIEGTKAAVSIEDMRSTTTEELNAIALDLVTQLKNHNGAKVLLLFANLKRLKLTRDLLRGSAIGRKIKLLSQKYKPIDPLYDEAIQEVAKELYQTWRAIWSEEKTLANNPEEE